MLELGLKYASVSNPIFLFFFFVPLLLSKANDNVNKAAVVLCEACQESKAVGWPLSVS